MRIRLKIALIDVATGQWDAFSPKPIQDTSASARYTRASSDQQQVAALKAQAYAELARDIVKKYAEQPESNAEPSGPAQYTGTMPAN